jgi:predicted DNA-binding antitoxin AbrB/MazE fold protein
MSPLEDFMALDGVDEHRVKLREEENLMTRNLKAVYENGVLRPLEPVSFKEHEVVDLSVTDGPAVPDELLDIDYLRHCGTLADDSVTIEEVRAALSKIPGSMAEEIRKERNDRV